MTLIETNDINKTHMALIETYDIIRHMLLKETYEINSRAYDINSRAYDINRHI